MDKVSDIQPSEFNGFFYVHFCTHLDCDGGGILTHGVPAAHHWIEGVAASSAQWLGVVSAIVPTLLNAVAGIVAGAVVLAVVAGVSKVWRAIKG